MEACSNLSTEWLADGPRDDHLEFVGTPVYVPVEVASEYGEHSVLLKQLDELLACVAIDVVLLAGFAGIADE